MPLSIPEHTAISFIVLYPRAEWLLGVKINEKLLAKSLILMPQSEIEQISSHPALAQVQGVPQYEENAVIEAFLEKLYQYSPFERIIAPDEIDILRAALWREKFALSGQTYESALAFRDKVIMKQLLQEKSIKIPYFQRLDQRQDLQNFQAQHPFPFIVKPCSATGCQGIQVIHSQQGLKEVQTNIEQAVPGFYQVETFVKGYLVHINGLYHDHKILYAWPSYYKDPPLNMMQGHYASSILMKADNPLIKPLQAYTEKVLSLLPTPSSMAFHLEVFITPENEFIFCEVASRVGGKGVNLSWKNSFDIDLKELFVTCQYGQDLPFPSRELKPAVLSAEIWFPRQTGTVQSVPKICPFPWVRHWQVDVQEGEVISAAQSIEGIFGGASLIEASTEQEMEERLQQFAEWFTDHLILKELVELKKFRI